MREFPDTKRGRAAAHTRSKVLAAAADLFATRGYPNVGIRDVAKAVGMSTGAVFSHFKDKDELWLTATGREPPMERVRRLLSDAFTLGPGTVMPDWARELHGDLFGRGANG